MWTLRAHPGWQRRDVNAPREECEADEARDSSGDGGRER
ncbi:hypothetical protein DFP74_2868 [Nocardiopsis sp. Huas11]|nr:hypothetical protein DFP74_2868 [Nocardiopsis sp. Huas11]